MNDTMLNINQDEEKPSNLKNMTVLLEKPEPIAEPEAQPESFDNTNIDAASTASPSSSPELK